MDWFCPMASDWGTWADLGNLLVAAVGAGAVIYLTKCANKVARRAGEVAEASFAIDRRAAARAEAERVREEKFLFAFIFAEVLEAHAHAVAWDKMATKTGPDEFCSNQETRNVLIAHLMRQQLPNCTAQFGRLHVISDDVAVPLARALGNIDHLKRGIGKFLPDDPAERYKSFETTLGFNRAIEVDLAIVRDAAATVLHRR